MPSISLPTHKMPCVQFFTGRTTPSKRSGHYFLFRNSPTHWRENWRNIRGFRIRVRNYYLMMAVWT